MLLAPLGARIDTRPPGPPFRYHTLPPCRPASLRGYGPAMNTTTNSNNKRPAPCDETWSNLSDEAQRRWRLNRTAKRKLREYCGSAHVVPRIRGRSTSSAADGRFENPTADRMHTGQQANGLSLQFQGMPQPFQRVPPSPVQHDGKTRIEVLASPVPPLPSLPGSAEGSPSMTTPGLPPTSSPTSNVDFGHPPKSHADELLHLLEFPPHMPLPSPSQLERSTPSYHLPRASEERSERAAQHRDRVVHAHEPAKRVPWKCKIGRSRTRAEEAKNGGVRRCTVPHQRGQSLTAGSGQPRHAAAAAAAATRRKIVPRRRHAVHALASLFPGFLAFE